MVSSESLIPKSAIRLIKSKLGRVADSDLPRPEDVDGVREALCQAIQQQGLAIPPTLMTAAELSFGDSPVRLIATDELLEQLAIDLLDQAVATGSEFHDERFVGIQQNQIDLARNLSQSPRVAAYIERIRPIAESLPQFRDHDSISVSLFGSIVRIAAAPPASRVDVRAIERERIRKMELSSNRVQSLAGKLEKQFPRLFRLSNPLFESLAKNRPQPGSQTAAPTGRRRSSEKPARKGHRKTVARSRSTATTASAQPKTVPPADPTRSRRKTQKAFRPLKPKKSENNRVGMPLVIGSIILTVSFLALSLFVFLQLSNGNSAKNNDRSMVSQDAEYSPRNVDPRATVKSYVTSQDFQIVRRTEAQLDLIMKDPSGVEAVKRLRRIRIRNHEKWTSEGLSETEIEEKTDALFERLSSPIFKKLKQIKPNQYQEKRKKQNYRRSSLESITKPGEQ